MAKKVELDAEKLRKLQELQEAGVNLFPYTYHQTHHAKDINEKYARLQPAEHTKEMVSVAGRMMLRRVMGKASFCHIQDQSGRVQLYLREDALAEKYDLFAKKLDLGDIIGAKGTIFKTKMGEVTIEVSSFEILSKSLLPMPEKFHGLKDEELRYRQRYLDFIMNPEVKDVFIKRAQIYKAIREFLDNRGFIEVRTPILQTQYGGANARPFITKINAWDMNMYLRIAYELDLKRLIVGGFEKVYDLSSCFRNEDADRTHNPEFAMMEIQWAYADYHDAMRLTEELWEYVANKVLGTTIIEYGGRTIHLKAPWKRLSVKDALKEYAQLDVDKLSDKELRSLIQKHRIEHKGKLSRGMMILHLFEHLCEDKLMDPVHIIDHPQESCPLAKVHRTHPELVERVEPFMNGWEVGNCYSELTDPIVQRKLLEEQAAQGRGGDEEAHPMDEDYINALEVGLPPNCGIGIGVDRMVMLLTGAQSIRDVILFPTMKPVDGEAETGKSTETKIAVAILNKGAKLERWQEMNTIAHLNAAFAARMGKQLFLQDTIVTRDHHAIKLNIQHAIMIKEGSTAQIHDLLVQARAENMEIAEFTREMLETTDDRKVIAKTAEKDSDNVEYLGILLFGKKSIVDEITKGLKLCK